MSRLVNRKFTSRELANECKRELEYRRYVYKRLVGNGKMPPSKAKRQIELMEEMHEVFEEVSLADEKEGRLL